MHDSAAASEGRVQRTYRERILPATYRLKLPLSVTAWSVTGDSVPLAAVLGLPFEPLNVGEAWGPPWGTTWMRVAGTVPADWSDDHLEIIVDLGFLPSQPGFQAEGLVWGVDGTIIKALHPRNTYVPLDASPGAPFEVYVEAASNPDVGADWTYRPTPLGDPATAGSDPMYRFGGAWLAQRDLQVSALERDWWTLQDLVGVLPAAAARRAALLRALERASDVLDPDDVPGTAEAARAELSAVVGSPAAATSHRIAATGHAHIDCAWLWPVRETIRKCARTFSNVLHLMEEYPDFVFAASSAQQYAWVQQQYPDLFDRIRHRVAEGRWVPVGGMWVEADTNMPGGEAMVRQFVLGKGYFLREFDVETSEVWLPDSFGFSAGLPQIMAAAGQRFFLTQKASWNETNQMPHHSFLWEGIDGTRIFTHFPPVDTYNSSLSAQELDRAERQHAERGLSDASLVPFGWGDGGGGPTREMIEVGLRKHDLEGSPRVSFQRPDRFFEQVSAELAEPAVWSGEIYLEAHRGTYTSQARTKLGNRRCEHLLRQAELWASTAAVRAGAPYPAQALRHAWETVLLQQFHDILPGSSIAWVHHEAERRYESVADTLRGLIKESLTALADADPKGASSVGFNASPFTVAGVPALGACAPAPAPAAQSTASRTEQSFTLESKHIRATFDPEGNLRSLVDLALGREALATGMPSNELQLFRDIPNRWDAWDIDAAYERTPLPTQQPGTVRLGGDNQLVIERRVGSSPVVQKAQLAAGGTVLEIETVVDWQERQKLLKLAFAIDVHADQVLSETQFGHVRRPLHQNTSWEVAQFETAGHRWVHVAEPGFGVTVANDRVYGRDVTRRSRAGGGTCVVVRESLLRAPTFPDPEADRGTHTFRHSIVLGTLTDGIAEGYRLNLPLTPHIAAPVEPLVAITGDGVLIECVKLAEDDSGDVVVRLYEALGRQAKARLAPGFPVVEAVRTDLLERAHAVQPPDALGLDLRAFELVTLRLRR